MVVSIAESIVALEFKRNPLDGPASRADVLHAVHGQGINCARRPRKPRRAVLRTAARLLYRACGERVPIVQMGGHAEAGFKTMDQPDDVPRNVGSRAYLIIRRLQVAH